MSDIDVSNVTVTYDRPEPSDEPTPEERIAQLEAVIAALLEAE